MIPRTTPKPDERFRLLDDYPRIADPRLHRAVGIAPTVPRPEFSNGFGWLAHNIHFNRCGIGPQDDVFQPLAVHYERSLVDFHAQALNSTSRSANTANPHTGALGNLSPVHVVNLYAVHKLRRALRFREPFCQRHFSTPDDDRDRPLRDPVAIAERIHVHRLEQVSVRG